MMAAPVIRRATALTTSHADACCHVGILGRRLSRVAPTRAAPLRRSSLLGCVALLPELRDHRLDVGEGPVGGVSTTGVLLVRLHLHLDLIAGIFGKFLHVALDEVNLSIQILITLLRIFELFL